MCYVKKLNKMIIKKDEKASEKSTKTYHQYQNHATSRTNRLIKLQVYLLKKVFKNLCKGANRAPTFGNMYEGA